MSDFVVPQAPVKLGTNFTFGPITQASKGPRGDIGPKGDKGDSGIDNAALVNHVEADEPHPAYDDMLDLTLLFENGLI